MIRKTRRLERQCIWPALTLELALEMLECICGKAPSSPDAGLPCCQDVVQASPLARTSPVQLPCVCGRMVIVSFFCCSHGLSYAISSNVRSFYDGDYDRQKPLIVSPSASICYYH